MNLLIVTTDSHHEMYEEFFVKTVPRNITTLHRVLSSVGAGTYQSKSWQEGVTAKLRWALENLENFPEEIFVLSDVDIQFFPRFSFEDLHQEFKASGRDILFQKETRFPECREVNTGFYITRSTPWSVELLREAILVCESLTSQNDQVAINSILSGRNQPDKWGHLPLRYYARSQGFPPPPDVVLHHANVTANIGEKVAQLRRVKCCVEGGHLSRWSAIFTEVLIYAYSGKLLTKLIRLTRRVVIS
jgi:Nucleotide-diphospho-sugar transferase